MRTGWLLWLAARLVPRGRRDGWLREWRAELVHLDRRMEKEGRGGWVRSWTLFRYELEAWEDAVGMRMRNRSRYGVGQELKLAARGLVRSPLFALMAVVTLALGIGANAAMFSVVRSVVLRPLPFPEPDELVRLRLSFRGHEGGERVIPASEPEYLELRAEAEALEGLAGYWTGDVNLGGGAEPQRVPAAAVSANFLDVFGVEPALGRGFAPGDDLPGVEVAALLSHGLWRRAFGADPDAVGRQIRINGSPATVVGVLPPSFRFPGAEVELLRPNTVDPADPAGRSSHYISMMGRLASGVSVEGAQARIDDLVSRWNQAFPGRHGPSETHPLTVVSLHESLVGDVRPMLLTLLGAVGLVLLIACANVASLLLVRAERRRRETGIRVALGGGRREVALPFLAESAVLSALGAGMALLVALASAGLLEQYGPAVLQGRGGVEVDAVVLLFTAGLAVLTTVAFGLGPALVAGRGDPARHLRERPEAGGAGPGRATLRRGLVVAETALAVMLVVASGLLLKSFLQLRATDPGFDANGVVTLEFALNSALYPDASDVAGFHEELDRRLAAVPGVTAAGTVRALPFARGPGTETLTPLDRAVDSDEFWNAQYQVVSPGYFQALDIPLVAGRLLEPADDRLDAAPVVVINQAMARQFWPGSDPLGDRFKLGVAQSPTPELTVVGVVGDVRQGGFASEVTPQFFVPRATALGIYGGLGTRLTSLAVRSELPPPAAIRAVRDAVAAVDPTLPVTRVQSMEDVLAGSVGDERFLTLLVGLFSLLALVLGAVGIGGLVSYTVARRTRELGLRMALGADGRRILGMVLGRALGLVAVGVAVGVAGAAAGSRLLAEHLFGVDRLDPGVFVSAPLVLLAVSLVAAWLPARRATRVDPVEAMRRDA